MAAGRLQDTERPSHRSAVRQRVIQALAGYRGGMHDERTLRLRNRVAGAGVCFAGQRLRRAFFDVHRLPWYLAVEPKRDVIELPISDELDVGGWGCVKPCVRCAAPIRYCSNGWIRR